MQWSVLNRLEESRSIQLLPGLQLLRSRAEENDMQRMHRYLGSLLLGVALIAPAGIQASNNFRDDSRQDARERNERNQRRYYDRDHRDYHQWDGREDGRYRHWGEERHEAYRPFYKVRRAQQRAYWKYRHEHPDRDDRR
jgi:hypothetical protein